MKKIKILSIFILTSLLLLTTACSKASETDAASDVKSDKLKVVASIYPPYDFIKNIGGDAVDVSMLLPLGTESHSYEPTPKDIITIQESDLFVYIGGVGDYWVDQVLSSMGEDAPQTLKLMDTVDLLEEEYVEGMEEDHDHEGHDHDDHDHDAELEDHDEHEHEAELDEHVWTSPKRVLKITEAIEQKLSDLDTKNAEIYKNNGDQYRTQLSKLDQDLTNAIAASAHDTIVVGDRFPFRYLAHDYNLNYFAAFAGCSTQTEPSAATVSFLSDKVRDEHIPSVLHLEFSNSRMAETIAQAGNAKTAVLHSVHNISKEDFENNVSYIDIMYKNIDVLKEALN